MEKIDYQAEILCNRISKRFNLEKLFENNTKFNGVEDTVVELCNRVVRRGLSSYSGVC